jgi:hypothetical protein
MALEMDLPPSKSFRPAPYKQEVHCSLEFNHGLTFLEKASVTEYVSGIFILDPGPEFSPSSVKEIPDPQPHQK